MSAAEKRVLGRLDQLITLGQQVLDTRCSPPPGIRSGDRVDGQMRERWSTSCLNFLERVFGPNSTQVRQFQDNVQQGYWNSVNNGLGVLLAARDDIEADALFELRSLIEAELFDDFLAQGEHLLQAGYHQPAAVMAGAVLEDGLRKLCTKNNIKVPDKPKLDWMNTELARAGVYTKLFQKRITALADLRNSAAHGKWDAFEPTDVGKMFVDVRDFMGRFFG